MPAMVRRIVFLVIVWEGGAHAGPDGDSKPGARRYVPRHARGEIPA
jgi:hypothetical protein